ncbi:MAG: hypothetical protein AB7M12_00590 [Hyphomonadaceae bacterium]
MLYASADNSFIVRLWNSRDGVAPFILLWPLDEKAGRFIELKHVLWGADLRDVLYVPFVGERIFTGLTLEKALERQTLGARERPEMFSPGLSVEEIADAIKDMAARDWDEGRTPDVVKVDPALRQHFLDQRNSFLRDQLAKANGGVIRPSADDVNAINGGRRPS